MRRALSLLLCALCLLASACEQRGTSGPYVGVGGGLNRASSP
jgi:hypothetical protein